MIRCITLKLLPISILLSLAGCTHTQIQEDGFNYLTRQTQLKAISDWEMNGRIMIDTGERAFQGRFRWNQFGDILELSIRGPFGANILQVSGSSEKLVVHAQSKTWQLLDPEPELSALLGWWLPVESLRAWLLGHSDPSFSTQEEFGSGPTLRTLEQRLWLLTYDSYQLFEGIMVPRRIDLSHNDLELRVIVDQWSPSS
jgi:outer membrane lipoprotein LolB